MGRKQPMSGQIIRGCGDKVGRRFLAPLIAGAVALGIAACAPNGTEVVFVPDRPDKSPPLGNGVVRVGVYVDTAQTGAAQSALGSVGNYILADAETPYFDYVIISGGAIKQGKINTYLSLSEPLQELLNDRRTRLKPLRDKGIKILLGITGGKDGVAFGSLIETEQALFARQCADTCSYYELDGVEFWDKDGESGTRSPYPEIGKSYWNGESLIPIPAIENGGETAYSEAWRIGGGNMANMTSYLIEMFGAASSFQGDVPLDAKENTPILVRETGYGKELPVAPPRYPFGITLSSVTYTVHDKLNEFGKDNKGESSMYFVGTRDYAPVQIDLAAVDSDRLSVHSKNLGRSGYGTPDEMEGDSEYGLVYYINLQPPSAAQTQYLSVTAREVFGEAVRYTGNY